MRIHGKVGRPLGAFRLVKMLLELCKSALIATAANDARSGSDWIYLSSQMLEHAEKFTFDP